MLRTALAAVLGCLLFTAPALAGPSCPTWEDGVRTAAEWSHEKDDRVAAVLLTEDETAATWDVLFPGKPGPVRLGIMISQTDPDSAFVAGFDAGDCLVGSGTLPIGPLIDAMVKVDVQSVFVIIEPRAKDVGA